MKVKPENMSREQEIKRIIVKNTEELKRISRN